MTPKVSLLRVVISGVIFTELFQKTLVTEPLDEDQIWEFDQKSFDLKIILKATD